jgi:hypothetical protein
MKNRPRTELKARFAEGSMPSMSDFDMLIDSTMNISDDGIEHSPTRGLCLTQMTGDERRLLSFYRQGVARAWAVGMDGSGHSLAFEVAQPKGAETPREAGERDPAVLTLVAPGGDEDGLPAQPKAPSASARIGVNNSRPACELDVRGTVASSARRGQEGQAAWADGQWHTIRAGMDGCVALEVVAGTGKQGSGKYALMHAFALKVFDAGGDITYHRTHYGARRHRLELRWLEHDGSREFDLQIKVNCNYGEGVRIRYHITELWDDPLMAGCVAAGEPR